ncbi:MAG: hypothetical protein NTZ08_02990 [Verrucomicrobia bacterium]|jgi:hypothetical protein|nr:hypothetical protein [Verrucomicrobiota bacterium]
MDIFESVGNLSEQLGLPVLLIGGHAVNFYGYNRTTLDVDFLIAVDSFPAWRSGFESIGYKWIGQTENFVRLEPVAPALFPMDVMLVAPETFQKLYAERVECPIGTARMNLPKPIHLIALKLHAMKNPVRLRQGKDLLDILNLVSLCKIDIEGQEFQGVLDRYANEEIRNLVLRSIP